MPCECCNSDAEHEVAIAEQMAYWAAYFGDSVRAEAESRRFYAAEGIDIDDQAEVQWRLKR